MFSESFIVPPLSNQNIEDIAMQVRRAFGLEQTPSFPVMKFLEGVLCNQLNWLDLQIGWPTEMQDAEGYMSPDGSFIKLRQDIYSKACENNGRARFTVAHELGHYFLHSNTKLQRIPPNTKVPLYKLSEFQADQFAACLLMPRSLITHNDTIEGIKSKFNVSYTAASNRLKKIRPELADPGRSVFSSGIRAC